MTEALILIGSGSLFTIGTGTLVIASLTLRSARRAVELAEHRMERLCKEHTRLLEFLREERQSLKRELKQESERRLEAERSDRERLLPIRQGRLAQEAEQHFEAQQERREERERRAHRDAGQSIEHLKRELQELRQIRQAGPSFVSEALVGNLPETGARERSREQSLPRQKAQRGGEAPRPEIFPDTTVLEPAGGPQKPRLGVRVPHPDDADRGAVSKGPAHLRSDAPITMFRKHYDKYLKNYEGYVDLAERLHRTWNTGEVPTGSFEEREWERRLQRLDEGITRTTARLDILEEHNPELATDDRISRRASIAQRYSELSDSK